MCTVQDEDLRVDSFIKVDDQMTSAVPLNKLMAASSGLPLRLRPGLRDRDRGSGSGLRPPSLRGPSSELDRIIRLSRKPGKHSIALNPSSMTYE